LTLYRRHIELLEVRLLGVTADESPAGEQLVSIYPKGLKVAESRRMSGEQSISDWVEAASCRWLHEAAFLQSVLEAAGIDATIPNEHTLGVQPLYANLLGGVRVLVRRENLERAREVLASGSAAPADGESGGAV
jgi:hypothetical protein